MDIQTKIVILTATGAVLAFLTRRSLKGFRTHGLYRLCAWIATTALILLNVDVWFDKPLETHQLLSWLFLLLSLFAAGYGYVSLRKGHPGISRNDKSLFDVERTTELVEVGAYHYVRHPMYSSFLLGACGVFLKDASWAGGLLAGIVILSTALAAKAEEAENILYFGDAYRAYVTRTKRFIPFLW